MKQTFLSILLACFALAAAAQESVRVNYQGAKPTISDFAEAFFSFALPDDDEEEMIDESANAMKQAWYRKKKGLSLEGNESLTIDQKNGYVKYTSGVDGDKLVIEMCYWNESDGKHKLFAYNVKSFRIGKYEPGQYDGITLFRYDNATKRMTVNPDVGISPAAYDWSEGYVYFDLPQIGKDLTVSGIQRSSGRTLKRTMKWNGRRFSF